MTYQAPLADMGFALKYGAGLTAALEEGFFGELTIDDVEAVLGEAGRIAGEVLAPLNRIGDREGVTFKDGAVTTPPGWKEAYRAWRRRLERPRRRRANGAARGCRTRSTPPASKCGTPPSMAFGVGPVLTMAAIDALAAHGSDALKRTYLGKLVSGEWIGTMQLTEPQAGSDVGALRTKAERAADGTYRITGQKIFITYGEHDLTDNIIHFVLARLPDAPPGTAASRCSWSRNFCSMPTARPAPATTCARIRSSTSSASMARRPARWFLATTAAPPAFCRRRKPRHGLHVHHDEPGAARRRAARRRHRRTRHAAGACLCARAQAGPRAGMPTTSRRSSRMPTSSAC